MSIQAVSFGATTKKGNNYKKTHAGTIAGAAVGTLAAADIAYTAIKKFQPDIQLLRKLKECKDKIINVGINPAKARKMVNVALGTGKGIAVAAVFGICLAIGAGVNKIINHVKAHKADKAAQ